MTTAQAEKCAPTPKEAVRKDIHNSKGSSIGLLGNYQDSDETRFLLTPEVCGILTSSGYRICMESGAASSINFTDEDYAERDVTITDRSTTLKSDYVLSFSPLIEADVRAMRPGCKLFCIFDTRLFEQKVVNAMVETGICAVCLDKVISHNGVHVFSDIIDEVDGRAAIWYAQEALSFLGGGRGQLLGGVAGVHPCSVLVIGEGRRAVAAAKAAVAMGAVTTLMDNDMSALQLAQALCGPGLITCAIHPTALAKKVKNADVILLDSCTHSFEFPNALKATVKKDVFVLDFAQSSPSISTPLSVTQGLSICLSNLFMEIILKGGFRNTLSLTPGVCAGVIIYNGKVTNKLVASVAGCEYIDLEMLLTRAN